MKRKGTEKKQKRNDKNQKEPKGTENVKKKKMIIQISKLASQFR